MNERIRELKEQAFNFVAKQNMTKKEYFWENIRHNQHLQDEVDKKFAELVVRECARSTREWYENHDLIHSDPMSYMLAHLGVEE